MDGGWGDGVEVGGVEVALQEEGAGLDHLDEVDQGAQFGGEEEDGQVVV